MAEDDRRHADESWKEMIKILLEEIKEGQQKQGKILFGNGAPGICEQVREIQKTCTENHKIAPRRVRGWWEFSFKILAAGGVAIAIGKAFGFF